MQVRLRRFTEAERLAVERTFGIWTRKGRMLEFQIDRFDDARLLLKRHHKLRAPDALHLAIASWNRLELATLDDILKDAALAEGLSVADL
ncbi:hypothetical protein BH09PSE1_BH09PSE1_19780 [soil metagenome]